MYEPDGETVGRIFCLLDQGDFESVRAWYEGLPRDKAPLVNYVGGLTYGPLGDIPRAQDCLLDAYAGGVTRALIDLANIYQTCGDPLVGLGYLERLDWPSMSKDDTLAAQAAKGGLLLNMNRVAEAHELLEQVWREAHLSGVAIQPQNALFLSQTSWSLGQFDRLFYYLDRGLESALMNPLERILKLMKAIALSSMERFDEAHSLIQEVSLDAGRLGPFSSFLNFAQGTFHLVKGDFADAETEFRKGHLAAKQRRDEDHFCFMGAIVVTVLVGQDRYAEARAFVDGLWVLDGAKVVHPRALGHVHMARGLAKVRDDPAQAIPDLQEAIRAFQGVPQEATWGWTFLAEAQLNNGDREGAARAVRNLEMLLSQIQDSGLVVALLKCTPTLRAFLQDVPADFPGKRLDAEYARKFAPSRLTVRSLTVPPSVCLNGKVITLHKDSETVLAYYLSDPPETSKRSAGEELFPNAKNPEETVRARVKNLEEIIPGLSIRTRRKGVELEEPPVVFDGEIRWDYKELYEDLKLGSRRWLSRLEQYTSVLTPHLSSQWAVGHRETLERLLTDRAVDALAELFDGGEYARVDRLARWLFEEGLTNLKPHQEDLVMSLHVRALAATGNARGWLEAAQLKSGYLSEYVRRRGTLPQHLSAVTLQEF